MELWILAACMAIKKTIDVPKTARYFLLGNLQRPAFVWFVLHGYGQLAERFARKFEPLGLDRHLVVARRGFHDSI